MKAYFQSNVFSNRGLFSLMGLKTALTAGTGRLYFPYGKAPTHFSHLSMNLQSASDELIIPWHVFMPSPP